MAIDFSNIYVTPDPLRIPPPDYSDKAGAVVDFHGVVRGLEEEYAITGLDYEAYEEMAVAKLRQIASETLVKFSLESVVLFHRIGWVPVGDPSLFLRVMAGHREEAFTGSREIIERLKQEVPIWKNPVRTSLL